MKPYSDYPAGWGPRDLGFDSWQWQRFISCPLCPVCLWGWLNLLSNAYWGLSIQG